MRWLKKSVPIAILGLILITLISCSGATPNSSNTQTPSMTSIPSTTPPPNTAQSTLPQSTSSSPSPMTTQTVTPSPAQSATSTPSLVVPTPTHVIIPTPSASPAPDPSKDKSFFIDRVISGYNKIPKPDGTFDQVPIYQDVYLNLNILGYYTKKDAYFVPRIPTLTDHDDWFIRIDLPGYLTKPWIVNWSYTINKSSPSADKATLSATVYTQDTFDTDYYHHPDLLTLYDLKGDRGPSSTGIYCKYFQNPGNYVILLRTNDADAIADFWVKIGTEGNVITPTP